MKVRMYIGGQAVEAEKVDYKPIEEPWSLYRLEDGTTVKLKLVVSEVFRLPNPDPVTGLPQLVVRSSNVISVEPPQISTPKKEVN